MTFQVVGESGKNPDFQNRCWGAVMAQSAEIMAATLNSSSVQDSLLRDLTTQDSKDLAAKFAKLTHLSTDRTIANLVLLNSVIAANPSGASDSDIQYQVKEVWLILKDIG